jgi:toxin-antitoxin system PIN domain toxin
VLSIDTNLLVYAQNTQSPQHDAARMFVTDCRNHEIVICELVLVELYLVLRSAAIVAHPLGAAEAAGICQRYRENPHWRLVECAPVMGDVWQRAGGAGFARRTIIDTRLALTLLHHGVTELATANTRHFEEFGFARVWNPVAPRPPRPRRAVPRER